MKPPGTACTERLGQAEDGPKSPRSMVDDGKVFRNSRQATAKGAELRGEQAQRISGAIDSVKPNE